VPTFDIVTLKSTADGGLKEYRDSINLLSDGHIGRVEKNGSESLEDMEVLLKTAAKAVGKDLVVKKGSTYLEFYLNPLGRLRILRAVRSVKIAPWVLIALLLLAFATTTPLWVARVPGASVTSTDPQIVLGLTALIVAVLALAGTVVYSLLKSQVEANVKEEVRRDSTLPLQISAPLQTSFIFFQDYSKIWDEAPNLSSLNGNQRFLYLVDKAIVNARFAMNLSRSLPEGVLSQNRRDRCTNALAYHLATKHKLDNDEMAKLEAVRLADLLRPRGEEDDEFVETLIWVDTICSEAQSKISQIPS
jgi:hypothetical protein